MRFVPVVPIRKIGVGTSFSRIYQAFLVNVPFVPIIFNLKRERKEYRKGSTYVCIYIRLVKNWNNWNKRAKPQVNTEKSCSNFFGANWNKTGTDPAILGVRLLPPPTFSGGASELF